MTMRARRSGRAQRLQATAALTALLAGGLAAGSMNASGARPTDDPDGASAIRAYDHTGRVQLVKVLANTPAKRSKVASLDLDVTESGDSRGVDVILHSARDAQILREAGFRWIVKVADLAALERKNARIDREYASKVIQSPLPSGQSSYRHLSDYNTEMRQLAQRFPDLVKSLTLKNESVEGRKVHGIEISKNVANVRDGKPVFLMMGAHHVREWPTGEHTLEFGYDLLENYNTSRRARRIVNHSRTILVPIVNPDGYRVSREADRLGDFSLFDYEMKRKNCNVSKYTPRQYRGGTCDDNPAGRLRGTDLNRNYPGFWGGAGASPEWSSDVYRGDGPGSEPEVDNIRKLISKRQVTALISNHTYSNLVLRPPSIAATGFSPDEADYRMLGDRMARANGYTSQASFQLYDTSGSTEDWSYWNTGGYGFTFEIGDVSFHPPYRRGVVAEYLGLEPAAGDRMGGNREAYYRLALANLKARFHSRITGSAPEGTKLTIQKRFISATSPVIDEDGDEGAQLYYEDKLSSSLRSKGGRFQWHVNPSTRPLVVGRYGREPQGPHQDDIELVNPPGTPDESETETTTFTIEGLPEYDNGKASIIVGWGDPAVDWDIWVENEAGQVVGTAASLDDPEVIELIDPVPGEYTLVVQNYEGGATSDWTGSVDFDSPTPPTYSGIQEAWTMTCQWHGEVRSVRDVVVDRGDSVQVGRACQAEAKR